MLKKAITITLLVILAWYSETVLEVILPLPTKEMVSDFLDLNIEWHYNTFKILRYIIWVLVLWGLLKYLGPFLGFILPLSQQFSTTKPLRRLHGITSKIVIFLIGFITIAAFTVIHPARKTYKTTFERKKELIEKGIIENYSDDRTTILLTIKNNRDAALRYLNTNTDTYFIKSGIWPLDNTKTIEQYSESKEFPTLRRLKNLFWKDEKPDIRLSSQYQRYFKKQQQAFVLLASAKSQKVKSISRLDELGKKAVREELGNPILYVLNSIKNNFWWFVFGGVIFHLLFHLYIRTGIGKGYERLLNFLNQGRFGKGGSARFGGLFEEFSVRFSIKKYSLFMGRSLYNPFRYIGLTDKRHMTTIAMTRGSKGASVIITNLLLWLGSTIVIDPKGTNAIVTARRRREMGQDVYLIDPFNVTKEKTASINILSLLNPESPTIGEELLSLAEALVIRDERAETHWSDGSKTIIAGLLAHLITSPKYQNPNLTMLRDLISMLPEEQAELWAEMSLNDKAGKLASDAAKRVIRGIGTDEITNILSNADKDTQWLNSPAIASVLCDTSFDFQSFKNKPTTIYLILPPDKLVTHNRFLRLFINVALGEMSKGGKAKIPLLMMIDEFLALGKMKEIEKAFPLMAGYNLVIWPFIQSLQGLINIYGKNGADTFLANSRAVQVFAIDGETKDYVSKHIGDVTLKKQRGKTVPLRTPSEVAIDISAESGRQYILRAGKPPLVLEKVPYYQSAPIGILKLLFKGLFAGKYDPDPDYA